MTDAVRIQREFVTAVFSGDHTTIDRLCHPLFELHEGSTTPFAGVYRGAAGFLRFLDLLNQELEIHLLEPRRIFTSEDPDVIACEFAIVATRRSTGHRLDCSLIELWEFERGLVRRIRPHYQDQIT